MPAKYEGRYAIFTTLVYETITLIDDNSSFEKYLKLPFRLMLYALSQHIYFG